jgi:hypothetical protein
LGWPTLGCAFIRWAVAREIGQGTGVVKSGAECSQRPLDHGAPVSTYPVARELGHQSEAMVRKVYAHLGTIRHRAERAEAEVVEVRVEQQLERLGDRLQRPGLAGPSVAEKDTAKSATVGTETPHDHGSDSGANVSDPWAWVELNYRPHAYQACALTT